MSLDSLQSALRRWKRKVSDLQDRLKKLRKRKNQVEALKKELRRAVDGNCQDINRQLQNTSGRMRAGICYPERVGQLEAILNGKQENGIGSDREISEVDEELKKELDKINREIEMAEEELEEAKRRVRQLEDEIRDERWKRDDD